KITDIKALTHDVKRFRVTKPEGYEFIPGEATDIVIPLPEWKDRRKPFTFTGLNDWDFLEFTIKIYEHHLGFTNQLNQIREGEEQILHDSCGDVRYKGAGTFIAGGAGITPFIAILRQLEKENRLGNNQLIYSNKTSKDIILKDEFDKMLGFRFINTLTEEKNKVYDNSLIDKAYLKRTINSCSQYFKT